MSECDDCASKVSIYCYTEANEVLCMDCFVEKRNVKRKLIESLPDVPDMEALHNMSLFFAEVIENRVMITYGYSEHRNH